MRQNIIQHTQIYTNKRITTFYNIYLYFGKHKHCLFVQEVLVINIEFDIKYTLEGDSKVLLSMSNIHSHMYSYQNTFSVWNEVLQTLHTSSNDSLSDIIYPPSHPHSWDVQDVWRVGSHRSVATTLLTDHDNYRTFKLQSSLALSNYLHR